MLARIMTAAAAAALLAGAAHAQSTGSTPTMPQTEGATSDTSAQAPALTPSTSTDAMPTGAVRPSGMTPSTMSPGDMPQGSISNSTTVGASSALSSGTMASGTTSTGGTVTVTNGPVPDTAETRAMYPPLSRAGKRTSAAGN